MKKYLEVEEIKRWFRERETALIAIDGSEPRWTASGISDNIDSMAAVDSGPEQKYTAHVDALLDLTDNPLGMVDCRHTREVIEDAANAFAILIFEYRKLRAELEKCGE